MHPATSTQITITLIQGSGAAHTLDSLECARALELALNEPETRREFPNCSRQSFEARLGRKMLILSKLLKGKSCRSSSRPRPPASSALRPWPQALLHTHGHLLRGQRVQLTPRGLWPCLQCSQSWGTPRHCNLGLTSMALLITTPPMTVLGQKAQKTLASYYRSIYDASLPCSCSGGGK